MEGGGPMREILTIFALVAAVAVSIWCFVVATAGCNQTPTPIQPEPGNPCGVSWHSCGNGMCCEDDWDCRPGGYCAFGGTQGPTWGQSKDGGPKHHKLTPDERRQLTPEQVRRSIRP